LERESAMAEAVPVVTTISPEVRSIELDAPRNWLAAGRRERRRVSLACGVVTVPLTGHATGHAWRALVQRPR